MLSLSVQISKKASGKAESGTYTMENAAFFGSLPQSVWLLVLLVGWALLLLGGFAFGRPQAGREGRMPVQTRLGSSLVLALAAWSWCIFLRGGAEQAVPREYGLLIAVGMTAGFTGDLFMAGGILLGGIGMFAIGHIAYISAMLHFASMRAQLAPAPMWLAALVWWAIGAAGWYMTAFRGATRRSPFALASLVYALLLASTAGLASGLALQDGRFIPLALGGALFLLSDLIIAGRMFSGLHFRQIDDVIWLTYGPAQALIVFSVDAVRRLASG